MRLFLVCLALLLAFVPLSHAATATLTWEPPRVGLPSAYLLYRRVPMQGWMLIGMVEASSRLYEDPAPLSKGCYQVVAQQGAIIGPPSNELCIRCTKMRCRQ